MWRWDVSFSNEPNWQTERKQTKPEEDADATQGFSSASLGVDYRLENGCSAWVPQRATA